MSPHSRSDQADRQPLASEFASAGFIEDEVKLDAPTKKYLDAVWRHAIDDKKYYHPSNNNHTMDQRPDNVNWDDVDGDDPDPYQETTKYRYRYYFDTRLLSLFNSKAEVRLEQKKSGEYKQVIKIGNGATADSPMMGRAEHPAMIRKFKPSFTAINRKEDSRKKVIALLNDAKKGSGPIKPLVAIRSQRRKMEYHPAGNRDITIEMACDIGKAMNVAGFNWNVRQIELEIKENNTDRSNAEVLAEELAKLKTKFGELEVNTESKPTPGFQDLIARKMSEKAFRRVNKKEFEQMPKPPQYKAS